MIPGDKGFFLLKLKTLPAIFLEVGGGNYNSISLSFRFEAAGTVHVHVEEENAKEDKKTGWLRWILSFFF